MLSATGGSGAAAAKPKPLRTVDTGLLNPVTDKARYVAYNKGSGTVRVRDTKAGTFYDVTVAADCRPVDAYRGIILVVCGLAVDTYRLLFPSTKTSLDVAVPDANSVNYNYVGRYWLAGNSCQPHCAPVYLNWRTGEQRVNPSGARDINTPNLALYDSRDYNTLTYGPPQRSRLFFRPAGLRSKRVLVRKCATFCNEPFALVGRAAWRESRTAYGYIHRGRQRCSWHVRFRADLDPSVGMLLLPTRYAMMVFGITGSPGSTLYSAPWKTC
jgi:hypothetical protein